MSVRATPADRLVSTFEQRGLPREEEPVRSDDPGGDCGVVVAETPAPALVPRDSPFGKQQTTSTAVAVVEAPTASCPPVEQREGSLHASDTGFN